MFFHFYSTPIMVEVKKKNIAYLENYFRCYIFEVSLVTVAITKFLGQVDKVTQSNPALEEENTLVLWTKSIVNAEFSVNKDDLLHCIQLLLKDVKRIK